MSGYSRVVFLASNTELSPKVVASAFWRGEVENELGRIEIDFKFKMDSDYDINLDS